VSTPSRKIPIDPARADEIIEEIAELAGSD